LFWFCSFLLLRLWGRLLLLWVLIYWRASLRHLNSSVSVLLLPICRIVHRPSIAAVSCIIIDYRDGGGGGGTNWVPHCRGIAIEYKVGYFKAEEFTYLEMEATSSAGTYWHLLLLLLLLLLLCLLWLLLLLLLLPCP
jgi:hypothetical protein